MKLLDLLKETQPKQFHTRRKGSNYGVDSKTGTITWSVKYNELTIIDNKLDIILNALEGLSRRSDDEKLNQLIDTFKKFKRAYRSHITRKYKK